MLSFEVFTSEFVEFLCHHFEKKLTDRLMMAYYESFQNFSDETFIQLCKLAFRECRFMPEPQWFSSKAVELSESARNSTPPLMLPDRSMVELEHMTPEQQAANLKRIRAMMQNTLKAIPGGKG